MKELYTILLDGELLPDMHVLAFENKTVALYSYLLLCIAYARKDLKLYRIGSIDPHGYIGDNNYTFVCDINTILARYDEFTRIEDEKNVPRDVFNSSLNALDVAVSNKFKMEVADEQVNQ